MSDLGILSKPDNIQNFPPPGLALAAPAKKDPKLEKAAKDFEAVFLRQILEAMDKTVDRSESLLSGGHAEEMFRGMMNEQIANSWSSKAGGSGFGLAENIYKQMELNMHPELSNPARHLTPTPAPSSSPPAP